MTYSQTLEWMFSRLPMYQRKGAAAYNAKRWADAIFIVGMFVQAESRAVEYPTQASMRSGLRRLP